MLQDSTSLELLYIYESKLIISRSMNGSLTGSNGSKKLYFNHFKLLKFVLETVLKIKNNSRVIYFRSG